MGSFVSYSSRFSVFMMIDSHPTPNWLVICSFARAILPLNLMMRENALLNILLQQVDRYLFDILYVNLVEKQYCSIRWFIRVSPESFRNVLDKQINLQSTIEKMPTSSSANICVELGLNTISPSSNSEGDVSTAFSLQETWRATSSLKGGTSAWYLLVSSTFLQ